MTDEKIFAQFLEYANNAAGEYDHCFAEPTYGTDEYGFFAQTTLLSDEETEGFVGDEEMPKLRLVKDVQLPAGKLENVVLVEWLGERAPSLCSSPHDLFAVFYS